MSTRQMNLGVKLGEVATCPYTAVNNIQIEGYPFVDDVGDNVPSDLVRYNLSSHIYHLNVGHVVCFFVFPKRNIL